MGSIPLPALSVNPGPSAADQFGRVLQLKSMLQQQQTQQLQQQALGQENQQRQIQLNDTQAASAAMHEWDGKDINDLPGLISKHGGSANAVMGMRNQILSYQTEKEKLTTAQLADEKTKNDYIAGHLQSVLDAPEEQRPQLFSNAVSDLVQKGYADPSIQNATYQNQAQVENLQKLHMAKSAIDESAKTTAQAAEAGAKAQLDILKSKGLQASPGDIQKMVSAVVPADWADPTLAQRTAARMNSARALGDPEGMQKALSDASAEVGTVKKETNPAVVASKEQIAATEATAKANIEHQFAVGGDSAVQNVATHLIPAAKADALKAGTEYAQEKSVSDRLAAMMKAAKAGNVISYQLIPQEGALQLTTSQGVKRINMAEIQNYGGGSLWQQMEGHIGKALTGKGIPESVLNDMEAMQKLQSEGAQTKYENTLNTVNNTYGSTFKPVQMKTMQSATPTKPDGATHIGIGTQDKKKHYLDKNGKDLGLAE